MNADLKKKWIEALRSGKYKQGTRQLVFSPGPNQETEYCCLGVLCVVAGLKKQGNHFKGTNTALLLNQREKLGLSEEEERTLTYMNDGTCEYKKSFNQIATYIQRYIKPKGKKS